METLLLPCSQLITDYDCQLLTHLSAQSFLVSGSVGPMTHLVGQVNWFMTILYCPSHIDLAQTAWKTPLTAVLLLLCMY
jgi:hypothetical protein